MLVWSMDMYVDIIVMPNTCKSWYQIAWYDIQYFYYLETSVPIFFNILTSTYQNNLKI